MDENTSRRCGSGPRARRGAQLLDGNGNSSAFSSALRAHNLDLGVAVQASTMVWSLDELEPRRGAPLSVQDLGIELGQGTFGRFT